MIIGSFNIREGGRLIKRKRIGQIVKNGKADIFLIQESKLESVDVGIINSFWPGEKVGWSFSGSSGASGGLISIWKEDACELKRKLWKDLLICKSKFSDGEWCIAGDFNAVTNKRERRGHGIRSRRSEMRDFSEFIFGSNLIDVQCKGKCFIWYSGDGLSMSRIDWFLLSDSLITAWGIIGQLIDNRDVSNHCPIWLISDFSDWGPKPFRVNDNWFDNSSFLSYVEREWRSIKVEGMSDFILKEKLRILKSSLRTWNVDHFAKIDLDIKEGIQKINNADALLEACREDFVKEVVVERSEATSDLWKKLYLKENFLRQKSRLKWDTLGDSNNKFFHCCMRERSLRNHISSILVEDRLLESVEDVKEEARRFFSSQFAEPDFSRPCLSGIRFSSISCEDVSYPNF
ncbi:uncharacterized protein LOC131637356 [Vicia villosa]|uniref:uncharacterized protein LOC131637356 n=1 Tax=Vicia villosa TaxID=3911 RepID=UPI00273B062E|nr:uncharacterized protein LOC131637356 [Vicia villosa]